MEQSQIQILIELCQFALASSPKPQYQEVLIKLTKRLQLYNKTKLWKEQLQNKENSFLFSSFNQTLGLFPNQDQKAEMAKFNIYLKGIIPQFLEKIKLNFKCEDNEFLCDEDIDMVQIAKQVQQNQQSIQKNKQIIFDNLNVIDQQQIDLRQQTDVYVDTINQYMENVLLQQLQNENDQINNKIIGVKVLDFQCQKWFEQIQKKNQSKVIQLSNVAEQTVLDIRALELEYQELQMFEEQINYDLSTRNLMAEYRQLKSQINQLQKLL
ncbi:hypothetical protein pb186bvf_006939 [Paramecium bursaria]